MTRKQMKKLAKELYDCERIHSDPNSSKEEKTLIEEKIMSLTNSILSEKNGMSLMLKIDTLVQELMLK